MRNTLICFVLSSLPFAAHAQQMDMAAMQKWGSVELVKYHIVGVYQDATPVASDSAGLADVSDRVVIDLVWKMSKQAIEGQPKIQNSKTAVANLRDPTPACLAPVLQGEYEHYELLSIENGPAAVLMFKSSTSYPVVEAAFRCTMSRKPVPAKVVTRSEDFSLPSPIMMAMGIPNTPELSITPDKKSFIVKKHGWTWTITPAR
jgi:hypothetical protein